MTKKLLVEALEDPKLPASLACEIINYLGSQPLDDLEDDFAGLAQEDPPELVRKLALRLGGLITQIIVSVMPPRTTLRHALAFQMIAYAHYEGTEITVAKIQYLAGLDSKRRPVFGSSLFKTYYRLVEHGLIVETKSKQDVRAIALSLSPKGRDLIDRALRQAGFC